MRYEIVLSPEAVNDMKRLTVRDFASVGDALERHLRYTPTKTSKSRIKRLRLMSQPQYRLRVDELRIYYDIRESRVEVLAVVPKNEAAHWLELWGQENETD